MNAPANISQPVEFSLPIKNYNEFYRFYLTEHRNINIVAVCMRLVVLLVFIFGRKPSANVRQNTWRMAYCLAMPVRGWGTSFMNIISQQVLNNRFIALSLTGECCLISYVVA